MFLHIEFADGSNPFVKYGSEEELTQELKKMKKDYCVEFLEKGDKGYWVRATNKKQLEREKRISECIKKGFPLF